DPEKVQRVVDDFGAAAVEPDDIYSVDADVFAPCALGAVINDDTLAVMTFDIVAGGANNQLQRSEEHGQAIQDRGILYAPDYAINAGGLINVYGELKGWNPDRSKRKAGEIYTTLLRIFETAENESIPTSEAADQVAEERILEYRHLQRSWV
ncbi:MAG TPA: Glu/Leu/Phe/Val dehydrogenase family protein, partial [Longimicrobiales bacterium]|nr:Glu/Leu/Phe/Val dehydrogenase family protein [Longimicrobiales bacterium]